MDLMDALGWVAGSEWPNGDPGRMRALAGLWRAASGDFTALENDIDAAKRAALDAYPSGQARDEIAAAFDSLRDGAGKAIDDPTNGSVHRLAHDFGSIADGADSTADEIESGQWMVESSLGLLAIEIAAAWAFPPTAPTEEALAVAFTRLSIRMFISQVRARIARWVETKIGNIVLRFLLRHVLINTLIGAGQDAAIQLIQIGEGHRKGGFDVDRFLVTTVSSAVGGIGGARAGEFAGHLLADVGIRPFFKDIIAAKVGGLAGGAAGWAAGLATQFGLDVAQKDWNTAVGNLEKGITEFDPRMLTGGAASGAITGMFKGPLTRRYEMSQTGGRGVAAGVDPQAARVGGVGSIDPEFDANHGGTAADSPVGGGGGVSGGPRAGLAGDGSAVRPASDGSAPRGGGSDGADSSGQSHSSATESGVTRPQSGVGGDGAAGDSSRAAAQVPASDRGASASPIRTETAGGTDSARPGGDTRAAAQSGTDRAASGLASDRGASPARAGASETNSPRGQSDSGPRVRAESTGSEARGSSRPGGEAGERVTARSPEGTSGGEKPSGAGDRAGHSGERPTAGSDRAAGMPEKTAGAGDRGAGVSEKPSGVGDRAGVSEKPSGAGDRSARAREGAGEDREPQRHSEPEREHSGRPGEYRGRRHDDEPIPPLVGAGHGEPGARPESAAHARPGAADAGDGSSRPRDPGESQRTPSRSEADRGQCGPGALRKLIDRFGDKFVRLPERTVGAEGMSVGELVGATGGRLRDIVGGHAELAETLRKMKDGAAALVVDHYTGGRDRHGVGAHAYLMVNERGRIVIHELDGEHGYPPRVTRELGRTQAVLFDGKGRPVDRISNRARTWLMAEGETDAAAAAERATTFGAYADAIRDALSRMPDGRAVLHALGPDGDPAQLHQVRELLSESEAGQHILAVLDEHPNRFAADREPDGRCGQLSLRELSRMFGDDSGIREPGRAVGPEGMAREELMAAAGGRLAEFGDHSEIANRLRDLGDGAAALVVDTYHGPADRDGVGGHAYLLVNEDGRIVVRDPAGGIERGDPSGLGRDVRGTEAVLFDRDGRPIDELDEAMRDRFEQGAAERLGTEQWVGFGRLLGAYPDQARELLRSTDIGRELLDRLATMPVHEVFESLPERGTAAGLWHDHLHAARVFTSGRTLVDQAFTLLHELTHGEMFVAGRRIPSPITDISRAEYIRLKVTEETDCFLREAVLAKELRAKGVRVDVGGIEHTYDTAYQKAVARRGRDITLSPEQIHERAHESAWEAAYHEIRDFRWRDGGSYAKAYGGEWDKTADHLAAHPQQPPPPHAAPARHPRDYDLTPEGIARMRAVDLHRSHDDVRLRELDATLSDLAIERGIAARDTADLRHRVARELAARERELATAPPERTPDLLRDQHRLRELSDLTDERDLRSHTRTWDRLRQQHAVVAADVIDRMVRDNPGAQRIAEHAVLLPGDPKRLVIAAQPGRHHDVLDDPRVIEAGRDAQVEYRAVVLQAGGAIHMWEPPRLIERPAEPSLHPQRLVETATRERLAPLLERLRGTKAGEWAEGVLRDVEIVHTADPAEHGYDSVGRRLVLDVGMSDEQHLGELVHGAIHSEISASRDRVEALLEPARLPRDAFIERMIGEETRAHAMEIVAALQLRAGGIAVPEPVGTHAYTEAYYRARARLVDSMGLDGRPVPERLAPVLDRMANEAGLLALRSEVREHRIGDESYRDHYGEIWDRANGVQPWDERVLAARASGVRTVEPLGEHTTVIGVRKVELVTHNTGDVYIRKTMLNSRFAAADELSAHLARALGVPAPRAKAVGREVYYEGVDPALAEQLAREGYGRVGIGLHDALVGLPRGVDRLVIEPDGRHAWVDTHRAFETPNLTAEHVTRYAERFVRARPDGRVEFVDHNLTQPELAVIRDRVRRTRPEFVALDREHWHDLVLERLTEIESHARPDPVRTRDETDPREEPDPPTRPTRRRTDEVSDESQTRRDGVDDEPPTRPTRRGGPVETETSSGPETSGPRGETTTRPHQVSAPNDGSTPHPGGNGIDGDPPIRPVRRLSDQQPPLPRVVDRPGETVFPDSGPARVRPEHAVPLSGSHDRLTWSYDELESHARTDSEPRIGRALDAVPDQLRDLLSQTDSGRDLLRTLDEGLIREQLDTDTPAGAHGEFTVGDMTALVATAGRAWDAARAAEPGESARPDPGDGSRDPGEHAVRKLALAPERTAAGNHVDRELRVLLDDANRGRCGELSLRELLNRFGDESGIRLLERVVGAEGMTRGELIAAAGGRLHEFADHASVANRLRELGDGAAALVVDMYRGPADRHGVGGHAYLLVNEDGRIIVRDPATGAEHADPARLSRDVHSTEAVLFDREGHPIDRVDEPTRERLLREAQRDSAARERDSVGQSRETPEERAAREAAERAEQMRREADADPGSWLKEQLARQAEWSAERNAELADWVRELTSRPEKSTGDGGEQLPPGTVAEPPATVAEPLGNGAEPPGNGEEPEAHRRRPLDQVRKFLIADAAARIDDPPPNRPEAEIAHARDLVEALRLAEALGDHPDPLAALQDLAEMARVRGFFDPEGGPRTMRYPEDMGPLDLEEVYAGEEYWRFEGDEQAPKELGSGPGHRALEGDSGTSAGHHRSESSEPRIRSEGEFLRRLRERLGLDDRIETERDRVLQELRYRIALRAGAIEALAEQIVRHEEATDPEHAAQIAAVRDGWARLLGVDPATLEAGARRLAELREDIRREAYDIADLAALTDPDRLPAPPGVHDLIVEVGGERARLRAEPDGEGGWRISEYEPPRPAGTEEPTEATAAEKKSWLRRLWEQILAPPVEPAPGAPSGSGGALQTATEPKHEHTGGGAPDAAAPVPVPPHPVHSDVTATIDALSGADALIKKLPLGLATELITFWKQRERIGDFFLRRGHDHSAPPSRLADGSEYEPWFSEADPNLAAQVGLPREQLEHFNRPDEPDEATPVEPVERRPELPPGDHPEHEQDYRTGTEGLAALQDQLRRVDDLGAERSEAAEQIVALTREYGVDLPDLTHESVRRAIDHLEYQIARRAAVAEGLLDATRWYNAADAIVPYSHEIDAGSDDPMARFLQELVRAHDADTWLQKWTGINNKTSSPPPSAAELFDEHGRPRDSGLRLFFEEALRREQIREQRATWEDMLSGDVPRDPRRLAEIRSDLREGTERRIEALGRLRELAEQYRSVDESYRHAGEELIEQTGTAWLERDLGGTKLNDGVWRVPGEPDGLVVLATEPRHEQLLARFLRDHPEQATAVNRGELTPDFRLGWVDHDGAVRIAGIDTPQARFVDAEIDGRPVRAMLVRDEGGRWRLVDETPERPVEELEHAAPHEISIAPQRPVNEIERQVRELAQRLELPPRELLSGAGSDLVGAELLRNAVRAVQIEALVDYVRSADAIERFNDAAMVRAALADRVGVRPGELTPERVADWLADPERSATWRNRITETLAQYSRQMRKVDGDAVSAAQDRLARRLGLAAEDLHPHKVGDDLVYKTDAEDIDGKRLAREIANLAYRPHERGRLTDALTEYVRGLMELDASDPVWHGDARADPRIAGAGMPGHEPIAHERLRELVTDLLGAHEATPERIARLLLDPTLDRTQRDGLVRALVDCVRELNYGARGDILIARNRLAPGLGLEPRDLYGHRTDADFRQRPDPTGIGERRLRRALNKLVRRGRTDEVIDPLTEFVRTVLAAEPAARPGDANTRSEMRVFDDSAPGHLHEVLGDPVDFAGRLAGNAGLAERGVHRDWARITGLDADGAGFVEKYEEYERFRKDLEDAHEAAGGKPKKPTLTEEQQARDAELRADLQARLDEYVKVYDAFRDGVIEAHERLSAQDLATAHAELRAEVSSRARGLRELSALLDEHRRAQDEGPGEEDGGAARTAPEPTRDDDSDGGAQRRPAEAEDQSGGRGEPEGSQTARESDPATQISEDQAGHSDSDTTAAVEQREEAAAERHGLIGPEPEPREVAPATPRRPEGTGRVFLSRIPHPPHFFSVDMPDDEWEPPELEAPEVDLPPEPPEPKPPVPLGSSAPPFPSGPSSPEPPSIPPATGGTPPTGQPPIRPPDGVIPPDWPVPQPNPTGGRLPVPPDIPTPPQLPPISLPPGMTAPQGNTGGAGRARGGTRRWEPERRSEPARLVVQPADGMGGPAAFDPATGALHGLSATIGATAGIYGRFGEAPGVLYRRDGRLWLWVNGGAVDLDDAAVRVYWGRSDATQAWFQVGSAGACVFDARYPFPGADLDFGRVIEQIVADPARRAGIFR
ncbi:hypothetical protein [Nocardia sp. NPDC051570]|uniref:WXG100-like domain-containing protein n=1 Tax=Nocardia sp. NPDC051570 TaxID=3364324 RepID=UPI0037BD7E45